MASTNSFQEGDRVGFRSSGTKVTTGTINGFGRKSHDYAMVHPDGSGDDFSILMPVTGLHILEKEGDHAV